MSFFVKDFISQLENLDSVKLNRLRDLVLNAKRTIIILGNGGSNALASHIAEDYTKALKKNAISFSDAARLTCYANDYGYENAFRQFLSEFSDKDSLVILISSSGNSENILNCAKYCIKNNVKFITLSGFNKNNKLKKLSKKAELDFWVNSENYGIVELTHETILHSFC
jgi:D-sedoheptulose 7-phosphate isomerase